MKILRSATYDEVRGFPDLFSIFERSTKGGQLAVDTRSKRNTSRSISTGFWVGNRLEQSRR